METHSVMLGLIYEVETSLILARRVYVQKDTDRQTHAIQTVTDTARSEHLPQFKHVSFH